MSSTGRPLRRAHRAGHRRQLVLAEERGLRLKPSEVSLAISGPTTGAIDVDPYAVLDARGGEASQYGLPSASAE